MPFLTILFPIRITAIVGGENVRWLAYITFSGAIAASVGNILFGSLSDRTGSRRGWIAAGLALSVGLLLSTTIVAAPLALLSLIVLWQLALNMMLGPLSAWAGDCVPRVQMGLLGGLLAFAPAMGALVGAFITLPDLAGPNGRVELVGALVVACVAPVLLFGRPLKVPLAEDPESPVKASHKGLDEARSSFVSMWLARLLVQIAEAALFAYLLLYFRSIQPGIGEGLIARLFCVVLLAAVPVALAVGRWADRAKRPFFPLAIAATLSGSGLIVLSLSRNVDWAVAGYILFGLATTVFLSLHSGQTLRVLPRPTRRGRDLGVFNLTNTVPSLIMPWLTLGLVPRFGFTGLFAILALLAFTSATILSALPRNS